MAVEFDLERETLGNLFLKLFNDRIVELHNLAAGPAKEMIMMLSVLRRFIKSIAARFEALLDDPRFQQDGDVSVNRIARDLQTLLTQAAHKIIDIEVTALASNALKKLQALFGQPKALSSYKF